MSKTTLLCLSALLFACAPVSDDDLEFRSGSGYLYGYEIVHSQPPYFDGTATVTETDGTEIVVVLDVTGSHGSTHKAECDTSHLSCANHDEWECSVPEAGLTFSGELCVGADHWGTVENREEKEKAHLIALQWRTPL